jgi:hypothetical protein
MTQNSTYDRIMHTLGLASVALIGASIQYPQTIPVWLVIVALVISGIAQVSTMPVTARPDTIIKAARSGGGGVLPVFVICFLIGGLTACPPAATPGATPTSVQTFDECTDNVVEGKAIALLGLVSQATLGDSATSSAALTALAVEYGWPEIRCAVQLFTSMIERKAALDTTAELQRERALMWLTRIEHPDAGP